MEAQGSRKLGLVPAAIASVALGTGSAGGARIHTRKYSKNSHFLPYFVPVKKGKPFLVRQAPAWGLFLVAWSYWVWRCG